MISAIANLDAIPSPALIVDPEQIVANIRATLAHLQHNPDRLRPHAKTHKTAEIIHLLRLHGVTRHKCATIAEAEMLAEAGALDVLIAYPMVGPNVPRLARLKELYPETHFSSLVDCREHVELLPRGWAVVIDLDVGQHRTGVSLDAAEALCDAAMQQGLTLFGLQGYDGHNHQADPEERAQAVRAWLDRVLELRARLEARGWIVPRIIAGGTPNFPQLAAIQDVPGLECSPGTFVLHDHGYGSKFHDGPPLKPALYLLGRVISKPGRDRVTLDLGTKAVASDPPREKRVHLLDVPPYEIVGHNEEHLVIETAQAAEFHIGQAILAVPGHVCPTVALHQEMHVLEQGRVVGTWRVRARDRRLSV